MKEKMKPNFFVYLGLYALYVALFLSLALVIILPFYGIVDIKIFLYIWIVAVVLSIPGFYSMIKFALRGNK